MLDRTPVPLTAGTFAYLDTFSGAVPCRVDAVLPPEHSGTVPRVAITLTATRGAYTRGEKLTERADRVMPRTCTYYRSGILRVRNIWHVVTPEGFRVEIFADGGK